MEAGPKKRFVGGHIEREDGIHLSEPCEHPKRSKERHVNIGHHAGLPDRGEKRFKTIKGGKVSLINRRILKED